MTNEEAKRCLLKVESVAIDPEFKEALGIAIQILSKLSLPSNLDEVAQKVEDYYDVGEEHGYLCCYRGDIKNAFKAGAEWMAGQFQKKPKGWLRSK